MSQLDAIADRRRAGGFNAREMLRHDSDVGACYLCRKYHPLRSNNADQDYADFAFRHRPENGCVCVRLTPDYLRRAVLRAQKRRQLRRDSVLNFTHNASVLEAFQSSDQALDLTSLNSLASSATAGWGSQLIDNSTNLYLDYLAYISLASVATAPGSDKCYYIFGASSLNTTDRPTTGASSSNVFTSSTTTAGALTYPSVSTLPAMVPVIFVMPYPVTTIANVSPVFSFARPFGGWIGLSLWYGMVNFSGMTIAASSNAWKYRGIYNTVA